MTLFEQLAALSTEAVNPRTTGIDLLSAREIVRLINAEDRLVADAVAAELDYVAAAVDVVSGAFLADGRLIYVGAGTSGRLGVVDASEMPPTFGTHHDMVQGVIAGGREAMFRSQEGAEDREEDGSESISAMLKPNDVVCGIAASGRTPFVIGAMRYAHDAGHKTMFVSTNHRDSVAAYAPFVDVLICADVGPEAITGSTRMKSGTAQKMILNMITTAAMVRIGKTYGNVMVDLQLTNEKLRERAKRIVMTASGVEYDVAEQLLRDANGRVKTAIVMAALHCAFDEASARLIAADGFVRKALTDNKLDTNV